MSHIISLIFSQPHPDIFHCSGLKTSQLSRRVVVVVLWRVMMKAFSSCHSPTMQSDATESEQLQAVPMYSLSLCRAGFLIPRRGLMTATKGLLWHIGWRLLHSLTTATTCREIRDRFIRRQNAQDVAQGDEVDVDLMRFTVTIKGTSPTRPK